jgi:hypothetical protein
MLLLENRAIPNGLVKHSGEFMEDEHSELKKRLRALAVVLVGISIGLRICTWNAFPGHWFSPFRWDNVLVGAFGAIAARICFGLLGQRKVITTLGIGEDTAKKLQ